MRQRIRTKHKNSERQKKNFKTFLIEGRREIKREREIEKGISAQESAIFSNTETIGHSSALSILKGLMRSALIHPPSLNFPNSITHDVQNKRKQLITTWKSRKLLLIIKWEKLKQIIEEKPQLIKILKLADKTNYSDKKCKEKDEQSGWDGIFQQKILISRRIKFNLELSHLKH